jgi:hypothetical protein
VVSVGIVHLDACWPHPPKSTVVPVSGGGLLTGSGVASNHGITLNPMVISGVQCHGVMPIPSIEHCLLGVLRN